jgi:hypothetical protein
VAKPQPKPDGFPMSLDRPARYVAGGRKDNDTGLLVEPFRTRAIKTLDGAEIRAWLEGEKLSAKPGPIVSSTLNACSS